MHFLRVNTIKGSKVTLLVLFLGCFLTNHPKAQTIIYDQTDLATNYNGTCYAENINFFPSIACRDSVKGALNVLPIYLNTLYNTRYAKSINDGPAWGGRGLNTTFGFGFSGTIGRLTYVINPIVHYSENRAFYTGGNLNTRPEYQNPYTTGIDLVSRYGDDPLYIFSLGQSELNMNLNRFEVALSSQNMRWGPALYNPIIMSTNAPGFPHLRIGTSKPLKSKVGDFEVNIFWGLLRESDYFNNDPDDDWRYFTGLSLGYQPSFFEGLSVGFNRVFYAQNRYLSNAFKTGSVVLFKGFFDDKRRNQPDGSFVNDIYDQIISGSMKWETSAKDLSFYLELFRGDYAGGIVQLLEQPETNAGYMIGMNKKFEMSKKRYMLVTIEHSELATWETNISNPGSLYTHYINKQGYTNNGQVIGASIGPGSQGDMITISYGWDIYQLMIEYQRSRYNDDYFYSHFTDPTEATPQDIEHQVGLKFSGSFAKISYTISSSYANRDNYLFDDDTVLHNVHSYLTLRYHF